MVTWRIVAFLHSICNVSEILGIFTICSLNESNKYDNTDKFPTPQKPWPKVFAQKTQTKGCKHFLKLFLHLSNVHKRCLNKCLVYVSIRSMLWEHLCLHCVRFHYLFECFGCFLYSVQRQFWWDLALDIGFWAFLYVYCVCLLLYLYCEDIYCEDIHCSILVVWVFFVHRESSDEI